MASIYSAQSLRCRQMPDDDTDPLSSVANISDAMLVFACGLLVALVVAWNVDIAAVTEVDITETQQIEDVQSLRDILESGGDAYIQRGTVYQDPRTGKLYMLEETDAQGNPVSSSSVGAAEEANAEESANESSGAAAETPAEINANTGRSE